MLFDTHTNLSWYPDPMSDEFVEFAWAAKKAKMRITPDVYCSTTEETWRHSFDSTPEKLLEATRNCDRVIVSCGVELGAKCTEPPGPPPPRPR